MSKDKVIGIDLGATNVRGAYVAADELSGIRSKRIRSQGTEQEVLDDVFELADQLVTDEVVAIGIGVPSVVDLEHGVVQDVQYIPSWKEVPLKKLMEDRYHVPVYINNDANCFALGEYYFGGGKGYSSMIGLTIGTGVGAGVIINNKLYAGHNCGAGEFGIVDYLDKVYEYYSSGSFFQNVYGLDGEFVFEKAQQGDDDALRLYAELGTHLGNNIKLIMYTYDPELIILGGAVRHGYDFFQRTMWERIRTCVYTKVADRLLIKVSELENSGILGAAALYYDAVR